MTAPKTKQPTGVKRLRPLPAADELAAMYPRPHDHRMFGRGHHERVEATIRLARSYVDASTVIADLSCGNGQIAQRLAVRSAIALGLRNAVVLGDLAPGHQLHGPIEETVKLIHPVDLFVCSETIEHLDDPADVLQSIRDVARMLVLSTPIECWDDTNGEHLWAWDRAGVEGMLDYAGWSPVAFDSVDSRAWGEPYWYGIWVAE